MKVGIVMVGTECEGQYSNGREIKVKISIVMVGNEGEGQCSNGRISRRCQ